MSQSPNSVNVDQDVEVLMRDGCSLQADVYRPAQAPEELPVLVLRTPYDRRVTNQTVMAPAEWYASQGFIVVCQDARGRFASDGEFDPFTNEALDGHDTVEWAARLGGSTGEVGLYGASYAGYNQLLTAVTRPPSLKAIAPVISGSDLASEWIYPSGVLNLNFVVWWSAFLGLDMAKRSGDDEHFQALAAIVADPTAALALSPSAVEPLMKLPFYRRFIGAEVDDDWWSENRVLSRISSIDVPTILVGGWYDVFNEGSIAAFRQLAETSDEHRLLIGPWCHVPWSAYMGDLSYGGQAWGNVVDHAVAGFFRYHLKGEGKPSESPVSYFTIFDNVWAEADQWPPGGTIPRRWFLGSEGLANSAGGDGTLTEEPSAGDSPDYFVYDPAGPVPSLGGFSCCFEEVAPLGPRDQRPIEARRDVLVYTTEPLDELLLAGPGYVDVWISTRAVSADYLVRLCVVEEEESINISEGIVSLSEEEIAETGDNGLQLRISLRNIAAKVRTGSRLRLHITGGSFPAFPINPQTGGTSPDGQPSPPAPASHTVYHDETRPSHLELTILPIGDEASNAGFRRIGI